MICDVAIQIEKILASTYFYSKTNFPPGINFPSRAMPLYIFSRVIYIYSEGHLNEEEDAAVKEICINNSLSIILRGNDYAKHRDEIFKPLAFISHDSRDKEAVALPIALGLIGKQCPVWYDEFSLKVGDKLRDSIEKGMKETKKCILILSKNFITNGGWTKTEFDSIFTREIVNKETVILPVWYGVTQKNIYEYSPSLADRLALNWDKLGKDDVVHRLHQAIRACPST